MGRPILKSFLMAQWIFLIIQHAESCYVNQEMIFGEKYYIYNTNFPGEYIPGSSCVWNLSTIEGTKIYLSCDIIDLPESAYCQQDKLEISLSGDKYFADSRYYCGRKPFSLVSQGNVMIIGLRTRQYSYGGKFLCTATVIKDSRNSEHQERQLITSKCDCGWKQMSRIVGGQESGVNAYGFMVALLYQERILCGSSIISNTFLLTAAHCVVRHKPSDHLILVGDHDVTTGSDTNNSAIYKIKAYEIHPQFDEKHLRNDIAIVQTTTAIIFGIGVGPVCLPFLQSTYNFADEGVKLLGWGLLEFTGEPASKLQQVDVTILTNQQCALKLKEPIIDGNICTFSEERKDACQMDSGGPVLWTDKCTSRYHLIGLISHGIGCGSSLPSVNTRVTEYLQWIVERTSTNFCIK